MHFYHTFYSLRTPTPHHLPSQWHAANTQARPYPPPKSPYPLSTKTEFSTASKSSIYTISPYGGQSITISYLDAGGIPQSQDKAGRVMHLNILPEPWARPHQQCRCPVLPRLFDILLGSPATIVRHVHEGTMTGVQSYQTRSTKYVQMSCLTDHSSL